MGELPGGLVNPSKYPKIKKGTALICRAVPIGARRFAPVKGRQGGTDNHDPH